MYKALIELANGAKLYGTIPEAISPAYSNPKAVKVGDSIKLKVSKVEPSQTDPFFGFFSRPRVVA